MADFFSSVFTIENDDDETLLENIQYDEHSNNDNFTLTEVNKLLKELNTTKSPGPDQVHPKVSSFSIVNTLLKKSANISAFSPSSEAIILIPSRSVCSSETISHFVLYSTALLKQGQYPMDGELAKLQHFSRKEVRTLHRNVVDLPPMKPNCFILNKSNLSIC
jgi:hypothetical protein